MMNECSGLPEPQKLDNSREAFLLAPECHSLWLLSPKALLLYDCAYIDERDLNAVVNPTDDTRFAAMKAMSAERLRKWGYLKPVKYRELLGKELRGHIQAAAKQTVERYMPSGDEAFERSRFFELSVYTHRKYAAYLENEIRLCPSQDDNELGAYVHLLHQTDVRRARLEALDINDATMDELVWALERITAKVIAGFIVSEKTGVSRLFDTDEYSPFAQDIVLEAPDAITAFESDHSIPMLQHSLAALSQKELPEVSVADEFQLFSAVRNNKEFRRVRASLRRLEMVFSELLGERSELVREKLIIEFGRLNSELQERFAEAEACLKGKTLWTSFQILIGYMAGFLSPLVQIVQGHTDSERRQRILEETVSSEGLSGTLAFLMDVWDRSTNLEAERFRAILRATKERPIWGKDTAALPWYENPDG